MFSLGSTRRLFFGFTRACFMFCVGECLITPEYETAAFKNMSCPISFVSLRLHVFYCFRPKFLEWG